MLDWKFEHEPREIERKLYFPEDPSFVSGLTFNTETNAFLAALRSVLFII